MKRGKGCAMKRMFTPTCDEDGDGEDGGDGGGDDVWGTKIGYQ